MESQNVNHDQDQTGECHSSTWEGRLNEMKADNEAQNARFNKFSRRTEEQLLDLNTTLQTILAQTLEKGKETSSIVMQICLQKKGPELRLSAFSRERMGPEHRQNAHQHKVLQRPELQLSAQQTRDKSVNYFLTALPTQDRMVLVLKI